MKSPHIFYSILFIGLLMSACNNAPKADKAEVSEAKKVETATNTDAKTMVDIAASEIKWLGTKVTGEHSGTLKLKDGYINANDKRITGGEFNIDLNSIKCTDLAADEGGAKLEGHLKSPDFFDVAKYPTAKFVINKMTNLAGDANANSMIFGNLTIKDVTKEIGFKANVNLEEGNFSVSTVKFAIDRTDFGIKYKSSKFFNDLADKAINDKFTIQINLK